MTEPVNVDAEISARVDEVIGVDADIVPAVAASQLVTDLRENAPALLQEWLDLHAEAILREAITGRIRVMRARARAHAQAGAFARAAKRFEASGDVAELSPFDVRHVVDGADTQRRVADMTGDDCFFVAERYAISSRRSALLAAFHRAVGQRVGEHTVSDVFSEAEYDRMYRSITGHPAIVVA